MANERVALDFNVPMSFKDSPALLCKLLRYFHALFVLFVMVSYLNLLCNYTKRICWEGLGGIGQVIGQELMTRHF